MAIALLMVAAAHARPDPESPVRLVVGHGAGGSIGAAFPARDEVFWQDLVRKGGVTAVE